MEKECLIICGMHRTGTSLLSSIIHEMGYYGGNNMMSPTVDNPKGYFENKNLVNLNERILKSLSYIWDSPFVIEINIIKHIEYKYFLEAKDLVNDMFKSKNKIFLKDPRISLLLEFWSEIIEQKATLKIISTLRHPNITANSELNRAKSGRKYHYFGFKLSYTKRVWFSYMFELLNNSKKDILVVSYDNMIDNPSDIIMNIAKYLQLGNFNSSMIAKLIDPNLRRSNNFNLSTDDNDFTCNLYSMIRDLTDQNLKLSEVHIKQILIEFSWYYNVKEYNKPIKEFPLLLKNTL